MSNILRKVINAFLQEKLQKPKGNLKSDCISEKEKRIIYHDYLVSQTKYFRYYLFYINEVLGTLKASGLISEDTKMCARIKSFDSACKNDSKKSLDDVFGIEINFATEREEVFVVELFKRTLHITKEKIHNKSNGYVAHHYSGYPNAMQNIDKDFDNLLFYREPKENKPHKLYSEYVSKMSNDQKRKFSRRRTKEYFKRYSNLFDSYGKEAFSKGSNRIKATRNRLENLKKNIFENISEMDENYIPIIEFQFKTLAVAKEAQIGAASHEKYKPENLEKIQNEYYINPKGLKDKLPVMYKSDIKYDDKTGKIINPSVMTVEEVLKYLYPSIKLENVDRECRFKNTNTSVGVQPNRQCEKSTNKTNSNSNSRIDQTDNDERAC